MNAKKVDNFFYKELILTTIHAKSCCGENTISVEYDFHGLVLSNCKDSYRRETIQMIRV
jgi:hypothetical protein